MFLTRHKACEVLKSAKWLNISDLHWAWHGFKRSRDMSLFAWDFFFFPFFLQWDFHSHLRVTAFSRPSVRWGFVKTFGLHVAHWRRKGYLFLTCEHEFLVACIVGTLSTWPRDEVIRSPPVNKILKDFRSTPNTCFVLKYLWFRTVCSVTNGVKKCHFYFTRAVLTSCTDLWLLTQSKVKPWVPVERC